ncbi:serine/threonine-protein kinase SMG1 [Galleria mellonella]|uniref:non-specific serine/threonine protein kinase n=1 Tax=Galleria mellonella TaxID=7137 RepID=A0ABM3N5U3_GALME|nr:serine/threonine-protein kinase SMG1 [Galleria mellonella]
MTSKLSCFLLTVIENRLFCPYFNVILRPCVAINTYLIEVLVMLSTTANSKVKNPKGSENSEAPERDEIGQENTTDDKVRGYVSSYDTSSSFGGPSRDGRFRFRGRVTEFRHSRGGGRGGRGRGGFPPRGDRDPLDGSYKYNESLGQTNSDSWSPGNNSNKFYERSELVMNLPEDPRISKLLRRLCAEIDVEKSLIICSKLQDAIMFPDNARYIRRAYDILVESLLDVFYDAPGPETKEGAAVVLGRIGYVMGPDFRKHLDWFGSTYAVHNTSIKHLLTLSFTETFQLDHETLNLSDFADMTLNELQTIIEGTDSADVFIAAINAMIIMSNSYPEHFANHFIDIVDILVGWHVDNAQPKKIKDFALQSLLKLSRHWQADVGFSVNMLFQFVEDMVAYSTALDSDKSDNDTEVASQEDSMQKITSFLNVFNTVVKSLGTLLSPTMSQIVTWSFLTESFTKIVQVLTKILSEEADTDLILSGNECIILLLKLLQTKSSSCTPALYTLIYMEMTTFLQADETVCLSVINLISNTIKEIASNLPIEFIMQTIGPESLLRPLRYSESSQVLYGVLSVYSNLLNLKNIPLLQETYKFVLTDIQNSYSVIIPDIQIIKSEYAEEVSIEDAEKNIIFYLQCLSELANASNSIIGMWALQPSILELLAIKMCSHNEILIRQKPALQYSILYLLYSHCKKNNHFIASSDLVTNTQQRTGDIFGLSNLNMGEVSGSSPTSGHLAVILNTLSMILDEELPKETLLLALNWISDIFIQLDKYLPIVSIAKGFVVLITNMLSLAYNFDDDIVLLVMKNCQHLLKNKSLSWNLIVVKTIVTLCMLHIDNQNKALSDLSKEVLFELPWDIVQQELDKQVVKVFVSRKLILNILNTDTKANSFKEYLMNGSFSMLSNHHFKAVMNSILQLSFQNNSFFIDVFLAAWPLQSQDVDENNLLFFRQCATSFSSICIGWVLSELAQTCVSLKLRTTLGKPQETFMKIEGVLKGIARDISSLETKYTATDQQKLVDVVVAEEIRSRLITDFMMFLEKYIYNAAEGTAIVLPAVQKPVRTFFHTNWSTCREWLTRVRPAALAVSLYAGNFGAAIYHASLILQTAANCNTNIDIEAITMSVARALIKIEEPEVLHGLYIWIKQTFDKKIPWLKGAAEQANAKYELAVEFYKKLNSNIISDNDKEGEPNTQIDTRVSRFIDEQIMDSYKQIQSWEDMNEWKQSVQQTAQNSQWNSFSVLNMFEDGNEIPQELCNWDILDTNVSEISKNTCSYQGLLNKIESTLVFTAVNIYYSDYSDKYENLLKDCEMLLNSSMEEFSRTNTVHFLKEISVLQLANKGLKNILKNGKAITNPFKPCVIKENKYVTELRNLSRILWWNQYFTKLNTTEENVFYGECLRLDVIKSARKNSNLNMAKRELLKYFKQNSAFQICFGNVNHLDDLANVLIRSTNTYDLDIWTLNNATALAELCKITYAKEDSKPRAINLCASISLGFSQRLAMGEQSYELREKGTRMLLTLSKWVQNDSENVLEVDTPLSKLVSALPEIGLVDNNISENVIPLSDSAVGKLLQFGVNQCPGLAKAWANFAGWCFRWGRKMVEFSSKTREQLTENDKLQIESVMIGCSPQDFDAVCEILSKTKATCDDEDIDWNEINTSEMIESQLRTVPSLSKAFPEHLALLVDIWRQAQKRVFSYFELSADAYFKFLQLICAADYINHSGENAVVNATLRLLRLIVKHAMELQTVLESGLANTPTQPWKVIIPQLFSRLNHPETYVRKCVSDLLCRLAEDTPHLITFPAVVGAVENEQSTIRELNARSFLSNDASSGDDNCELEDSASDKVVNNELNSCFLDMVETLSKQAPKTILQVKLLVKELQRINLLWDELCLGTLVQNHSDFSKRLSQLEAEVIKVKNNENLSTEDKEKLIKEKHRIIFEPIVFVLENLDQITSAKPETPHETAFQNKFQNIIKDVIEKLKNPVNPEKPQESWAPLKQLQIKLQQKINKRTSYILKMSDISPILAELKNTVITMPGLHTNQRTVRVTIKSVENNVSILPTKTRPKKLIFYGSDGKAYTYLFKGLEDLHLDERIMQLLSITNTMMARDSENNDNQTYRARHYSVIPLGPRSGLISWVDNVTPLFALYKRWQNREAAILSAKTNKIVNVLRPSELFYNKLNPLLKEAGIATENRKEWPVSILKQVLQELSTETPRDLLWRELWCGSVTSEQWWQMVRRYCYSVAVMSTIGYIIGLGDRHLDNVLVDLTSGEVVHIDYNVCFEKGKTLRVPEKVPFRMTPNLVTALGVTGVEGIFRLACEHVLRTMRRGRETLLTLLEAFVYDPLVEWGAAGVGAGAGGGKRRRTQRDIRAALDMLAVRAQELKHQVADLNSQFLAVLPEVKESAENWLKEHDELEAVETRLQECHQQMALIKEIEAYGPNLNNHPLYAISQKYTSYKKAKNAVEDSMKALVKILKDFDTQIETFAETNEVINGPQLMAWVQEFSGTKEDENKPIFDHIKEFLTNAGQSSMISQCEQAETELNQSIQQTHHLVRSCLELLSQYVAVSQYYPQSQTEYHRVVMFRKFLATALESKSPEVCREVSNQMNALLADSNNTDSSQITAYNFRLQTIHAEASANLNKAVERLQAEGGPDALVLAQEAYMEAKANISNWVRTEDGAAAALECVVIGMLCNLNRRYLMLENGAQSAGDCLVDLTSREGEWFLDDMSALSMQSVELLSLLPLQSASAEDTTLPIAVECVRNANLLLADLVQLNYNFSTIILPEALKKVHSEDPSALLMITELNTVIMNTPVPLNDLLAQLEMHLRYLVMDMESPANGAQLLAAELRSRYEALLSASTPDSEGQSAGRMLLMGFNGLFAAVELRARELADHIAVPTPPAWRKIDHINEAMHMSAALQSPVLRSVLEDIFLVRRIQTVAEVFAMCVNMARAFNGVGPLTLYDDAALCKPVRRFTAEYVLRGVVGVHSKALACVVCGLLRRARLDLHAEVEQKEIGASWSVPLEALCEKARALRAGAGGAGAGGAGGAGGAAGGERGAVLAGAVRAARAQLERAARAVREHARAAAAAHAARHRAAAHHHLHAEVSLSNTLARAVREHARAAAAAHAARHRAAAHHHLHAEVSLSNTLAVLAGAVRAARAQLERAARAVREHARAAAAAHAARHRAAAHHHLHAEVLQGAGGAGGASSGGCGEAAALLWRRARELLAAADELAAARARAHGLVGAALQRVKWGAGANPALRGVQRALEAAWAARAARADSVRGAARSLAAHARAAAPQRARAAARTAHTARTALQHWHKACTLAQKYSLNVSPVEESLMEMLHPEGNIDTQWVENVSALVRDMSSQLASEAAARRGRARAAQDRRRAAAARLAAGAAPLAARALLHAEVRVSLHALAPANNGNNPASSYISREAAVTAQLSQLASCRPDRASVLAAATAAAHLLQEIPALHEALLQLPAAWEAQTSGAARQPVRPPPAQRPGGERNAQGAGVWKRVRLKLEGRDPEPARRLPVSDQVEYMISEATSAENLCLMYEGWMAWV